jgi:hypothetical protein
VSKLVLLSIVVALVVIPIRAARQAHPLKGLRVALLGLVSFHLFYAFLLRVVVPRLG